MEIRATREQAEVEAALRLRERVFCGEQGVTAEAERDGHDAEALHIVALKAGEVVGTCRLLYRGDTALLGRMAVEPGLRNAGVGAEVLSHAESLAAQAGAARIGLHAQRAAESLYRRAGFVPYGGVFIEECIEHVAMEKLLAPSVPARG